MVSPEKNIEKTQLKENKGKDSKTTAEADASAQVPVTETGLTATETNFCTENELRFLKEQGLESHSALREKIKASTVFVKIPPITITPDQMAKAECLGYFNDVTDAQARLMVLRQAALAGSSKAAAEQKRKEEKKANGERYKKQRSTEENMKNLAGRPPPQKYAAPRKMLEALWMQEYTRKFPDAPLAKHFSGKENGQIYKLLDDYDVSDIARAISYMLRYWDKLQSKFVKGTAHFPTLGLFVAYRATIIPEAKLMLTAFEAKAAYDQERKKHEMDPENIPKEIKEAYNNVKSVLLTLDKK